MAKRKTFERGQLTDRQLDVLRWLDDKLFARPMDVGGHDASHHSYTLRSMAKRGLVAIEHPNLRGGKRYRRTPAGKDAVRVALSIRPARKESK